METRNDESKCPQTQNDAPKSLKSRLERWIEKLEERIAPTQNPFSRKCDYGAFDPTKGNGMDPKGGC